MPTFKIEGHVTVSCWTEIEAPTEEEALQIATSRELATIHIDGSFPVSESWHLDTDGMPFDLRVDR